jgi:hypothetical protein
MNLVLVGVNIDNNAPIQMNRAQLCFCVRLNDPCSGNIYLEKSYFFSLGKLLDSVIQGITVLGE